VHPAELILVLACLAPLLVFVALPGSTLPNWMPVVIGLLLGLDLVIAGPRWSMLPAYGAALALIALAAFRFGGESRPALIGAWGCLLLLAGAACLSTVLPRRTELRPSGPFKVGVIVDAPAIENVDGANGEAAPPVLRIWYPAVASSPEALLRNWFAGRSPALVAGSSAGFPVLVAIPGWDGTEVENTSLVRELVSHGFIVAALEYPAPVHQHRLRGPMDFSSEAAFRDTVSRGDELTRIRALDASGAVDRLTRLNSGDPGGRFARRLDLRHIGVFGFSLGGAAAAQACWQDERFGAAVNLDGWQFADAARDGVRQPYLLLSGDSPLPGKSDLAADDLTHRYMSELTLLDYQRIVRSFHRHGGLYVRISGSQHPNFAGQATIALSPGSGIALRRVLEIINAYVLAFFRKHLDGIDSPLLEGDSAAMPEAHVQAWAADTVKVPAAARSSPPGHSGRGVSG